LGLLDPEPTVVLAFQMRPLLPIELTLPLLLEDLLDLSLALL
jgi:hypothetical protein